MKTPHTAIRDLAGALRRQTVRTGSTTPEVRGAQWRRATIAVVGVDGTVTTDDGITARRLESYQAPTVGDIAAITSNGAGGWLAWGRTGVDAGQTFVRKTAATGRTATATPANDPNLTLPVLANAVYELTAFVAYTADAAADVRIGWSVPAGSTLLWSCPGASTNATTAEDIVRHSALSATSQPSYGGVGVTTNMMVRPYGLLRVGATAGSCTLQWSQGTSGATTTTVLADSFMTLNRVA